MVNFAFIDAQNINLSIREQGWKLDWKRLFIHLQDKYLVKKAYIFIGFIPTNQDLYSFLQDVGFHLIFKPVLELKSGKTKGNVDAELVLQAMIDYDQYNQAVLVTGDGDFACLVRYLRKQHKLRRLIVPNSKKYSCFLKTEGQGAIDSLSNLRLKLEYKKKRHELSTDT